MEILHTTFSKDKGKKETKTAATKPKLNDMRFPHDVQDNMLFSVPGGKFDNRNTSLILKEADTFEYNVNYLVSP